MSKKRITDFFTKPASAKEVGVDSQSITPESETNEKQNSESEPSSSKKLKLSHFQSSWKNDWPWLTQNEKGEMLCSFCIENKLSNTFTTGYTNFRTSTLARHVDTAYHKRSVIARSHILWKVQLYLTAVTMVFH